MTKEEEEPAFRVTDKRHFRSDGEVRESGPDPQAADPKPASAAKKPPMPPKEEPPPGTVPQIDFPSYLLSYYTQGLMLLGEVPHPVTNERAQDLEAAHHTVDILAMLQEKTRGNLSEEEDKLLDSILYELRMKFMAKTKRIKL